MFKAKTILKMGMRGVTSVGAIAAWAIASHAASAQSAPSAEGGVNESDIVVTARKREERVQDVPVQIAVATAAQLQERSVTSFAELGRTTPSLIIVPSTNSHMSMTLFMRGQSMVDIRLNQDLAIAIYQDGVYLPRAQGANATDLFDLDRVEVLAGPQGTLYGKNSTGGVLHIFTHLPTDRLEGTAQLRAAQYGELAANAMINIPLGEGLAFRGVAGIASRDGYGRNLLNGRRLGKLDAHSLRGTLAWEGEGVKATLRGNYTHANSTGLATKGGTLSPADALGDPDDASLSTHPGDRARIWGASLTVDVSLNDNTELRSITAANGFRRRTTLDIGGSATPFLDYPDTRAKDRQFSQELQLGGVALSDRLDWMIGGFASDEKGTEQNVQITGVTQLQLADIRNRSIGAFVQGSYKITPDLSLTLGARYSADSRQITNYLQTLAPLRLCQVQGVPIGATTIPGAQVTAADCRRRDKATFDGISYTASLDYKVAPGILLYAKTSRGYRSGGLQQTGGTTPTGACVTAPSVANCANFTSAANIVFAPYRPETLTDYEVGIKADLFDRLLRVNLTYYHARLKDALRGTPTQTPAGLASIIQNAAMEKVDGVEWQISLQPAKGLELFTTGAYTNARFAKYTTLTGEDRSNIDVLFSPKWQVNIGGSLTHEIDNVRLRASVDYAWTDRMLATEPAAYVRSHGLLNGRLAMTLIEDELEIAVFGKNLTNFRYLAFPAQLGPGLFVNGFYNTPRTLGAEMTKRF